MHIHRKTRVRSTTEAEVEALKLAHKCDAFSRTFPTQRGLKILAVRWCAGGVTQRSRRGSMADRTMHTAKRRAAEALLSLVYIDNTPLENVYSFEYLGARLQCDGVATLMIITAWPSHSLYSARSPAYGQTTGCRGRWSWGRSSLLCVRRWLTHLKPGCSLSQWCAVWTVLTADACT